MPGAAFASGFVKNRIRGSGNALDCFAQKRIRQQWKKSYRPRLSLQDVPPILLPPPPTSLPIGTIYHVLRGSPKHLTASQHSIDGDGYVLALTLSPEYVFLRGRYVRTRAYLRESRAEQRLYPSRGGTPSTRRYRRLKKSCGDGVLVWSEKLFAWGESGLPMWLDPSTLVSRGYSALGTVLTDREELFRERGQALAAPPVALPDKKLALCASGAYGALFVNIMNDDFKIVQRVPPVQLGRDSLVLDFAVTEKFFVVLFVRTVGSSTAAAFRQVFSGATAAADIDVHRGSFLTLISRSNASETVILDVPSTRLCFRILNVEDDGIGVALHLLGHLNTEHQLSRAQLADIGLANAVSSVRDISVSQFVADPSSRQVDRVETAQNVGPNDSVLVHSVSPCAKFAAVVGANGNRAGIAQVKMGVVGDVAWVGEDGASVSGVAASPDGNAVSALVVGDGCASVRFWDAERIRDGAVYDVELSGNGFGDVRHSCGCAWEAVNPKWPGDGKVVKSAYEIFDDRNWNDINSGFSSLGINQ